MKFSALVAALAMVVPSLAAPAPEVDARQVITFADTLTIALTSRANGTFLDRTVYGTRTTPRLTAEEGEEWRYAFQTNTDPKAFTWNSGGKKLQVCINDSHLKQCFGNPT